MTPQTHKRFSSCLWLLCGFCWAESCETEPVQEWIWFHVLSCFFFQSRATLFLLEETDAYDTHYVTEGLGLFVMSLIGGLVAHLVMSPCCACWCAKAWELDSTIRIDFCRFGWSCPVATRTLGVAFSSCRLAATIPLAYSCYSWSEVLAQIRRQLIASRSLPVLMVIVSPLLSSITCFVVITTDFSLFVVCEMGASISREGFGARKWDQRHQTVCDVRWLICLVDCWLILSIVRSRCRSSTIVDVAFSLSVVSRIHSVMGSDRFILLLSFHRDVVWDHRDVDNNSMASGVDSQHCPHKLWPTVSQSILAQL